MRFAIITLLLFALISCKTPFKKSASDQPATQGPNTSTDITPLTLPSGCDMRSQAVDDVSKVNAVSVAGVCKVTSEEQIKQILSYARTQQKKVAISGVKHSQGGHTSFKDAIVLDMTSFNQITLNAEMRQQRYVKVQAGATWDQIQKIADGQGLNPSNYALRYSDPSRFVPVSLSVKVMQSSNIFTVGGSLSVNCHGRDVSYGPFISTVRSFRIMLADGSVVNASRNANTPEGKELFRLAVGGFGLFGVVLDVELDLADNVMLEKSVAMIDYRNYGPNFVTNVLPDQSVKLHFGRLNVNNLDSKNFLKEMYHVNYRETQRIDNATPPLSDEQYIDLMSKVTEYSERNDYLKGLRWLALLQLEDKPGVIERTSLNQAMRPPIQFLLKRNVTNRVNILQEYFIPVNNFAAFTDSLRSIALAHNINLQNVTIRYSRQNSEAMLNWAKIEVFAFALFINLDLDATSQQKAAVWTQALVNAAQQLKGNYYLPYQRWPTRSQLLSGYPEFTEFLSKKAKYDPAELFVNQFYSAYKN